MLDDDLRSEIRNYQEAQADLRKWKFIVIGTVAGVGIGLAEKTVPGGSRLALFILPFIAIYPDLLVRDYDLRITVISAFMRLSKDVASTYEQFIHDLYKEKTFYPWLLGQVASFGSTIAACVLPMVLGILYLTGIATLPVAAKKSEDLLPSFREGPSGWLLLGSGMVGVILFTAMGIYHWKAHRIVNEKAATIISRQSRLAPEREGAGAQRLP